MWIHGVSAVVEDPRSLTIQHAGFGTSVKLAPPTPGESADARGPKWINFAIPTPSVIDGDEDVAVTKVHCHASLKGHARVIAAHVWMGERLIYQQDVDWQDPDL